MGVLRSFLHPPSPSKSYYRALTFAGLSLGLISWGANFNLVHAVLEQETNFIRWLFAFLIATAITAMLFATHKRHTRYRLRRHYFYMFVLGVFTIGGVFVLLDMKNQSNALESPEYNRLQAAYQKTEKQAETALSIIQEKSAGIALMHEERYYTKSLPVVEAEQKAQSILVQANQKMDRLDKRLAGFENGEKVFIASGVAVLMSELLPVSKRQALLFIFLFIAVVIEMFFDLSLRWREDLLAFESDDGDETFTQAQGGESVAEVFPVGFQVGFQPTSSFRSPTLASADKEIKPVKVDPSVRCNQPKLTGGFNNARKQAYQKRLETVRQILTDFPTLTINEQSAKANIPVRTFKRLKKVINESA